MIALLPGAALAVTLTVTPAAGKPLAPGNWGGDHVAMTVSEKNVSLEFDCAYGRTDGAFLVDQEGGFDIPGVFVRQRPGPTRVEDEREQNAERVRYVGRVEKDAMAMRIVFARSGEEVGRFELERGRPARLLRCQ